jgi:hypothetical protein
MPAAAGGGMTMSDEDILRQRAREAILAGKLPQRRPERIWAGPGFGHRCTICDRPVARDDVEYELEFARDRVDRGRANSRVHFSCLVAWESECRVSSATADGAP